MSKSILVLGDMHIGSWHSVSTPKMHVTAIDNSNASVNATDAQLYLLEGWKKIAKEWRNSDEIVILGDAVDVASFRSEGSSNMWSINAADQIKVCKELMSLYKPKKLFLIRGTAVHVIKDETYVEEILAESLGAQKFKSGTYTRQRFIMVDKYSGIKFDFAHHVGTSRVFHYRSTPITRELMTSLLVSSEREKADVIVRGHAHYFWHTESEHRHAFIAPCWQLATPLAYKMSPAGAKTGLGALRFITHKDGTLEYQKRIIPHPEEEIVEV